jgi:CRISPR-associated protein Cmr5
MKTLEQEFAGKIYQQVAQYKQKYPKEDDPARKKYGSMAHKLPILVRTAGLAQALAFVDSRGKDEHKELLQHLAQVTVNANVDEFLRQSREADLPTYIYLTRKTMLALKWYKRFAQSVLKIEPGEEDN